MSLVFQKNTNEGLLADNQGGSVTDSF